MERFGVEGVPALVLDDGTGRRLLPRSALFSNVEQLIAQLQTA